MPNTSLYQITKSSIQQGIQELQQKIRRRKQFQYQKEIQSNIIKSDQLYQYELELDRLQNSYQNAKYDYIVNQPPLSYPLQPLPYMIPPPVPYSESILIADSIKYTPVQWTYEQLKDKIKRQAANLDYLRQLQRIKQQSLFIEDRLSTINKASLNNTIDYDRHLKINHKVQQELQRIRQLQILQEQRLRSPPKNQSSPFLNQKQLVTTNKKGSPIRYINSNTSFQQKSFNKAFDPYSILQYDDPQSQDSSVLVDKYYKGIRAEQYNHDMKRLALIEQKLRKVEQKQQYYRPQFDYNKINQKISVNNYMNEKNNSQNIIFNRSPQRYKKNFETPQQIKSSRKKDYQKTKQKSTIPIIKQDIQQGQQTIVNTINKNTNRNSSTKRNEKNKRSHNTSQFANQKLKQIINSQKKQFQPKNSQNIQQKSVNDFKKTYLLNEQNLQNRSKGSNRPKKQLIKRYGNTIDVCSVDKIKKNYSPIKTIQNKKYNPYLGRNEKRNRSLSSRYKNKSEIIKNTSHFKNEMSNRSRSNSNKKIAQNSNKCQSQYIHNKYPEKYQQILNQHKYQDSVRRSRQICIPAPLYPASEQIAYNHSQLDHIRKLCQQKIQKRLQMSSIVFKDSKMRNVKHEMDHLLSKFQNQIKSRKQIRDKINTNPRILRKHKMVVEKLTI